MRSDSFIGLDMTSARQGDLFGESQSDQFDEDAPTPVYRADPDEVRAELYKILAEARATKTFPWEPKQASLYRTIFPQMTNWLPRMKPRSSVSISNRNWPGSMLLDVGVARQPFPTPATLQHPPRRRNRQKQPRRAAGKCLEVVAPKFFVTASGDEAAMRLACAPQRGRGLGGSASPR
jgi:hypothetical protein